MEDGDTHGDRGIQFLHDLLENNDPNWLSTNEFDDLLANMEALEALIWATSKSRVIWKWVIIAAHATLQSLAVCKLTRTDGFGAKDDNTERRIGAFYAEGKNTLHNSDEFDALAAKESIANFPTLMRRLGYEIPKPTDDFKKQDATNLALYLLHDFRSTYLHYPSIHLTVGTFEIRQIVRIAVNVLSLEIGKDDWKRRPLITLDEVTPLLDSINRRFEDFEKE